MKDFKYILVLAFSLVLLSTSCKKGFLETAPSDAISEDQASESLKNIESILEGTHSMMYRTGFSQGVGQGVQSINTMLDMLGDDMVNSMPAYLMGYYRWTDHRDPYGDLNFWTWDFYYTVIQHCNMIFDGLDKLDDSLKTRKSYIRTRGETLVLRAYCYGNLVQLFGKRFVKDGPNKDWGVLLRLTKNYDPMPRSTVGETYEQINKDLTEGLALLKTVEHLGRKNRISYATACGIAARIALAQYEYAKAEELATTGINNTSASLQSGEELLDGFNNLEAKEWLWGYRFSESQNPFFLGWANSFSYNFATNVKSGIRFAVNRSIYDKMGSKDIRRKWWVCLDQGDEIPKDADVNYFRGGTAKPNWEYTGQCIKFKSNSPTTTVMDHVVMRLSELYYILAEAQAMQGKEAEAMKTLNTVMQTRDPEYNAENLSGDALVEEIFRNKRIDLYMEGVRFFDMKRTKHVPDRLSAGNDKYMSDLDKANFVKRNSGPMAVEIPTTVDAKQWEFVIPYGEIKGNKLIKDQQNPL